MGKAEREWAKRARLALVYQLGGECAWCGSKDCLHIDHIERRLWNIRKVDPSMRVSIYRREALEGKLQVLCLSCNVAKRNGAQPPERCLISPTFAHAGDDPF